MSGHCKTVQCLKYDSVMAFVSCMIHCVVVFWQSGNGCVFELNVIYLNFFVIHGLSSVSGESKVNGYGVCFACESWRSFDT